MVVQLTTDCVEEILKYLSNDVKTLHSCLLVNRSWCRLTVPILWCNPWKYKFDIGEEKFNQAMTMILLSFIPLEIREVLRQQYKNVVIDFPPARTPLFKYTSYCQYLPRYDIRQLWNEIENRNGLAYSIPDYVRYFYMKHIYMMFINSNSNLKHLELPQHMRRLIDFCACREGLSQLQVLECNANYDSSSFYEIAEICRSLQKLIVDCDHDNDGLATLIRNQHGLEYLEIASLEGDECTNIGNALKTQADTLSHIRLSFLACISPKILWSFINLKTLQFDLIDLGASYVKEILEQANFPYLEVLDIFGLKCELHINLLTRLIKQTQHTLQRLYWNEVTKPMEEDLRSYLEAIALNCPNLKFITIPYMNQVKELLENLLISCQQLEGIKIVICEKVDANWVFECLGKKSSKNLHLINLSEGWWFSHTELEAFFKMWKERRPMIFISPRDTIQDRKIIGVIEKYLQVRTIKKHIDIGFDMNHIRWIKDSWRIGPVYDR
ncbi:17730_t:CDS:1 [Dentiscutata erythropus]|uniref:17730_t:CDS:1 n=1 Tax=Dentiscutata erythropus TaxID=1348616 RepID=A0A9N9NQR2_9GLOM|nr:17730_t:CDS:1 [Dentiscutata erythropus]